jgi:hypothetical protein
VTFGRAQSDVRHRCRLRAGRDGRDARFEMSPSTCESAIGRTRTIGPSTRGGVRRGLATTRASGGAHAGPLAGSVSLADGHAVACWRTAATDSCCPASPVPACAGISVRTRLIAQRQRRAGEYRRFVGAKQGNDGITLADGRFNFDGKSNASCYGAIQRGTGAP